MKTLFWHYLLKNAIFSHDFREQTSAPLFYVESFNLFKPFWLKRWHRIWKGIRNQSNEQPCQWMNIIQILHSSKSSDLLPGHDSVTCSIGRQNMNRIEQEWIIHFQTANLYLPVWIICLFILYLTNVILFIYFYLFYTFYICYVLP